MVVQGEHCCCWVNLIHILQEGGGGGWLAGGLATAPQSFGALVLISGTAAPARAGQTKAVCLGRGERQIEQCIKGFWFPQSYKDFYPKFTVRFSFLPCTIWETRAIALINPCYIHYIPVYLNNESSINLKYSQCFVWNVLLKVGLAILEK